MRAMWEGSNGGALDGVVGPVGSRGIRPVVMRPVA